jgi:hypothetical protein
MATALDIFNQRTGTLAANFAPVPTIGQTRAKHSYREINATAISAAAGWP